MKKTNHRNKHRKRRSRNTVKQERVKEKDMSRGVWKRTIKNIERDGKMIDFIIEQ